MSPCCQGTDTFGLHPALCVFTANNSSTCANYHSLCSFFTAWKSLSLFFFLVLFVSFFQDSKIESGEVKTFGLKFCRNPENMRAFLLSCICTYFIKCFLESGKIHFLISFVGDTWDFYWPRPLPVFFVVCPADSNCGLVSIIVFLFCFVFNFSKSFSLSYKISEIIV